MKGNYLLSAKRYQDALQVFKELIVSEPSNSYAFRGLVRAYQGAGQMKDGENFLKDYTERASESFSGFYGLGYLYYLKNEFALAEKFLKKSVDANPENALALNTLGALYSNNNNFSDAIAFVKKAIEINPGEPMFFRNLNLIYKISGNPIKFEEEFLTYLKSGPADIAHGYGLALTRSIRQEGFKLYSQDRLREALDKFLKMLKIYQEIKHKPGIVIALFSLGTLFEELGNLEEAREYFQNVLKISPLHIQARERLKILSEKSPTR